MAQQSAAASRGQRPVDFELVEIDVLETFPPQFLLRVAGVAPHADMTVRLQPDLGPAGDYRRIEVLGTLTRASRRPPGPFETRIPLTRELSGRRGVELVGASRSERIDLKERAPDVIDEPAEPDIFEEPPSDDGPDVGWPGVDGLDIVEGDQDPDIAPGIGTRTGAVAVRGIVCDDAGWPLTGAQVTIRPTGQPACPDDPVTRTGADGRYRQALPAAGRIRVTATASGYHPAAGETWIAAGRAGRIDLFLSPDSYTGPSRTTSRPGSGADLSDDGTASGDDGWETAGLPPIKSNASCGRSGFAARALIWSQI